MVLTISKSLLCFALLAVTAANAQKYTPPPPPLVPGPCVPTKKEPCDPPPAATQAPAAPATDNFPFPGEHNESKPATTAPAAENPFPGEQGTAKPAPTNAATQNPFPGEPEAPKPANPNTAAQNPFPGEPAESSSSSSGSSESGTTTGADSVPDPDETPNGKALTRTQRRHLAKVEDIDHRELEDLDISRYYISMGNFKAAYLRAKDAVSTIPDDSNAYFALAEAASRMKNTDEAITNYKKYLEMDPEGIHAKAAHKALAVLAPK
jgi:hypothetical protein